MTPAAFALASSRVLRTPIVLFVTGLLAACSTPNFYRTDRELLYPTEWPDVVSAGADCKAIEGTFENKGTVIESTKIFKPLMQSSWETKHVQGWLSDMFIEDLEFPPAVAREQRASLDALRSCERVSLRIEPYAYKVAPYSLVSTNAIMLIIDGSSRTSADPEGKFELCASLRVGQNECKDGGLVNPIVSKAWAVRLGSDGSLIVRRSEFQSMQLYFEEVFRAAGRFNRIQ